MIEIRTGNQLSCESAEAVGLYQQAVDQILGSESGAAENLDKALALDGHFALAAAARYCVAKDIGESDASGYRELAEQASLNATEWERQHIEVLIGLLDQPGAIRERAFAYINENPADLLVVSQLAGYLFFYAGPEKLDAVLNLLESVEDVLQNDWAFMARLGFAASEAGQRRRGRELIEKALAIRPQALYSIHGLAHVLHDDGAAEESAQLLQDWLRVHESSSRNGQMYGHVQWHLALSEWQIGDRENALQRYLAFCAPDTTTCGPILTLADCGGFLLRDYLQSGQTRPLAEGVPGHIEKVWGMIGHPFIALHVAGLFASAGDMAGIGRCQQAISAIPASDNKAISLALVSALTDLQQNHLAKAAKTLASISPGARIGIGGSNVERILIDLIEERCNAA